MSKFSFLVLDGPLDTVSCPCVVDDNDLLYYCNCLVSSEPYCMQILDMAWFMVHGSYQKRKSKILTMFVCLVSASHCLARRTFFTLAEEKCQQSVTLLQLNIFLPNALFIRKFPPNPTISLNGKLNFIFKFCDNNTVV